MRIAQALPNPTLESPPPTPDPSPGPRSPRSGDHFARPVPTGSVTPPKLRAELESFVVQKGTSGSSFRSDAFSWGRGRAEIHAYRLKVFTPEGKLALNRRFSDEPSFEFTARGDLVVLERSPLGDTKRLHLYERRGDELVRTKRLGTTGFLGWGNRSVSGFAVNPQGTKLAFALTNSGKITLPELPRRTVLYPDGRQEEERYGSLRTHGEHTRIFVHDLEDGTTREVEYALHHQLRGGFHPKFKWSENGRYFGYESPSPSYAYVFATTGRHLSTHQTREVLGYQGGGAVPLLGVNDDGSPRFPPTGSGWAPIELPAGIPLGE